jgi:hypothetical protein
LGYETYATHSPLTENTTYKIADIPIHIYSGALVEIEFLSTSGGGLEYQGAGKVVYEFKRASNGTVTGSAIVSRYTGLIKPCVPIISGGTGVVTFFVNDNATATANFGLTFNIKIVTTDWNTAPTIFTAAESYGTAGTPLAANI